MVWWQRFQRVFAWISSLLCVYCLSIWLWADRFSDFWHWKNLTLVLLTPLLAVTALASCLRILSAVLIGGIVGALVGLLVRPFATYAFQFIFVDPSGVVQRFGILGGATVGVIAGTAIAALKKAGEWQIRAERKTGTSRWRANRVDILLTLAALSLLSIFPACAIWLFWAMFFRPVDYGAMPPERVFKYVFRRPVPRGVSAICAAGHGVLQGHEIWMRFSVTDAALEALLPGVERETARPFRPEWLQDWLDGHDACAAHWDEVPRIRRPVYYFFGTRGPQGAGATCEAVLDRAHHLLYVRAGLL